MPRHFPVIAGLLSGSLCACAQAQPVYTVIDLGTLPGREACACFSPHSLSENGLVVGDYFSAAGDRRGFIWHDGVMHDLGVPPLQAGDRPGFVPFGVSSAGIAVGSGPRLACAGTQGNISSLPSLGGPFGTAHAINEAGVIVGQASSLQSSGHAVMWSGPGGAVTDLGTLGGDLSDALAINDLGHIVGSSLDASNATRAFLWTPQNGMTPLMNPPGASNVRASGINQGGQILGTALVPVPGSAGLPPETAFRGFIWNSGVPTNLGDLSESRLDLFAGGINDRGQIVGVLQREGEDTARAFIWEAGTMTDLNTLIDPQSGWNIAVADINNAGAIAGLAFDALGRLRAVLLSPAAPPCPADFNGDAFVNPDDLADFITCFFLEAQAPGACTAADFNADASVNPDDLSDFITAFFLAVQFGC